MLDGGGPFGVLHINEFERRIGRGRVRARSSRAEAFGWQVRAGAARPAPRAAASPSSNPSPRAAGRPGIRFDPVLRLVMAAGVIERRDQGRVDLGSAAVVAGLRGPVPHDQGGQPRLVVCRVANCFQKRAREGDRLSWFESSPILRFRIRSRGKTMQKRSPAGVLARPRPEGGKLPTASWRKIADNPPRTITLRPAQASG